MKKIVQGPGPRTRNAQQHHTCIQRQQLPSLSNVEQIDDIDDECPEENYDTKLLEERGHVNNRNDIVHEYSPRYPTKDSMSWESRPISSPRSYDRNDRFHFDRRCHSQDGAYDHGDDALPPNFDQKRGSCWNHSYKPTGHKPYYDKYRYRLEDEHHHHQCPRRGGWEKPRGSSYHYRASNQWFRHSNEPRSHNFFMGSHSSPMRDFVQPSSSWLHVGEPHQDLVRPCSTEPKLEGSFPPPTPPLENVGAWKKSATQLYEYHGEAEDRNKDAAATPVKGVHRHGDQREGEKERNDIRRGYSRRTKGPRMQDSDRHSLLRKDSSPCFIKLMKDNKMICRTECRNPPIQLPFSCWNIEIVEKTSVEGLADLPKFPVFPAFENTSKAHQNFEWNRFLTYLHTKNKVATVEFEGLKVCLTAPEGIEPMKTDGFAFDHAVVAYEMREAYDTTKDQNHAKSVSNAAPKTAVNSDLKSRSMQDKETQGFSHPHLITSDPCMKGQMGVPAKEATHSTQLLDTPAIESDVHLKGSNSAENGACSSISKYPEAFNGHHHFDACFNNSQDSNFVRTDPSYLKTLGQAHSGWIFGAIAELVDNSRDANASRLEIGIEMIYDKRAGCDIPMLSVIDDGNGMNHQEILRMVSFGHKQPDEDNRDRVGRFGVGFKTGAMRLGKDALVLTQTTESRSIAFLSQSLNEGKDNVEIPIVSYRRQAQCMEFDATVQSEARALHSLRAIKEFSPFNEYLIGEKSALFKKSTGTQIYIWNLDKWGSGYSLEWQAGVFGRSLFHDGDILIRSRRVRSRPGQTSRKVPLDYSLRSYLEVIFLEPRMKIYVQGSPVKCRPLAKCLNNTAVENGEIMGKPVQLTLGRYQLEWDQANCGVFLYWHGRLIEAYKRVGGMVHSADIGRGVIGVIDVTELMDDGNGSVWVHSNKQGFLDCEPYVRLEEWLGLKTDEYWDTHFDALQLRKGNATYDPDHEWVQCDKCRKWRILNAGFDSSTLTGEWFCYMEPFNGRCEEHEQKAGRGVITIGTKRVSYSTDCKEGFHIDDNGSQGKAEDNSNESERPVLKRLRRGTQKVSPKNIRIVSPKK